MDAVSPFPGCGAWCSTHAAAVMRLDASSPGTWARLSAAPRPCRAQPHERAEPPLGHCVARAHVVLYSASAMRTLSDAAAKVSVRVHVTVTARGSLAPCRGAEIFIGDARRRPRRFCLANHALVVHCVCVEQVVSHRLCIGLQVPPRQSLGGDSGGAGDHLDAACTLQLDASRMTTASVSVHCAVMQSAL
jgi:hypothetical protein